MAEEGSAGRKLANIKTSNNPNLGKGPGRPPGSPNKVTAELKTMILEALEGAGGVEYLQRQADATPAAFMALLGRVLPMQVTGEGGGPIELARVERIITDPKTIAHDA